MSEKGGRMTDGRARLSRHFDKMVDLVDRICKDQRRDKMAGERENLCKKCEDRGGELKCVEGDKEITIQKCDNPDWASMLNGREIVVECSGFREKE